MQQSGFGIAVTGSGSCTPQVSLDNNGLSQIVETSDEWIGARTGIRSRRLADDRTSLCDLASRGIASGDRNGRNFADRYRFDYFGDLKS